MQLTPVYGWFRHMTTGWGWSPTSLEGWFATAVLAAAIVAAAKYATP
jgi:hypothetical protein